MKHKSFYQHLFKMIVLLFLISFTVVGTLLFGFVGRHLTIQREKELKNIAGQIINFTVYMARTEQKLPADAYRMNLDAVAQSTGTEIFVLDGNGRLVATSAETFGGNIKSDITKDVLDGKIVTYRGTLSGIIKGEALTVAVPIEYMDTVVGGVVVSIPTPEVTKLRIEVLKIFIINGIIILALSAIFVYFLSKRISKPLSELNEAAKSIAGGDFKKRVSVSAENELSELGETFNHMAESIEQLENMRSSFIANVSHDLRTPMTTIIGFVEGILDGTIPEDKHKWYLSVVLDESKRLSRIVTDLLDLSKLEQGSFNIEKREFDINELVRLNIIKFEKRITEKNIRLSVGFQSDGLKVYADKDAIQRVLTNLLDNAIKFTSENGYIDINTGTNENNAFVSIENSGMGIEKKELLHIFDRFYKTDKSRSQDKNGAGLGLYIVKSIIKAHNEKIWAESEPGEFARFTFTLTPSGDNKKTE
ncbi:MAG: HAMP domain-containing histidine kinase [Clostridia bacterium]|nr:HAMP domain-containing histidine kinase [Clostridia bacterium]